MIYKTQHRKLQQEHEGKGRVVITTNRKYLLSLMQLTVNQIVFGDRKTLEVIT
jgi:hypothetical protein